MRLSRKRNSSYRGMTPSKPLKTLNFFFLPRQWLYACRGTGLSDFVILAAFLGCRGRGFMPAATESLLTCDSHVLYRFAPSSGSSFPVRFSWLFFLI